MTKKIIVIQNCSLINTNYTTLTHKIKARRSLRFSAQDSHFTKLCQSLSLFTTYPQQKHSSLYFVCDSEIYFIFGFLGKAFLMRRTVCLIFPIKKFSSSDDSVSTVSRSGIIMSERTSPKLCIFFICSRLFGS